MKPVVLLRMRAIAEVRLPIGIPQAVRGIFHRDARPVSVQPPVQEQPIVHEVPVFLPESPLYQTLRFAIEDNITASNAHKEAYKGTIDEIVLGLRELNPGLKKRAAGKAARELVRSANPRKSKEKPEKAGVIVDFQTNEGVLGEHQVVIPTIVQEPLPKHIHGLVHQAFEAKRAAGSARSTVALFRKWDAYLSDRETRDRFIQENRGSADPAIKNEMRRLVPASVLNPAGSRKSYERKQRKLEAELAALPEDGSNQTERVRSKIVEKQIRNNLVINLIDTFIPTDAKRVEQLSADNQRLRVKVHGLIVTAVDNGRARDVAEQALASVREQLASITEENLRLTVENTGLKQRAEAAETTLAEVQSRQAMSRNGLRSRESREDLLDEIVRLKRQVGELQLANNAPRLANAAGGIRQIRNGHEARLSSADVSPSELTGHARSVDELVRQVYGYVRRSTQHLFPDTDPESLARRFIRSAVRRLLIDLHPDTNNGDRMAKYPDEFRRALDAVGAR